MYSVLNTLSKYTYFYISKNITSYTFSLVSKIVESLQCILNTFINKNRVIQNKNKNNGVGVIERKIVPQKEKLQ